MKKIVLSLLLVLLCHTLFAQTIGRQIDSLIAANKETPFNGVVHVWQNGKTIYSKAYGFADREKKILLKTSDQFGIGSISKQITAVIILREYEKGHLDLHTPIRKYLPQLTEPWADSVTIHHLLTHTHGIRENIKGPLVFTPGTRFEYSNTGYGLLAQIAEHTSGKSFETLSAELFKECGMTNTFHPALKKHKHLVNGYAEDTAGHINFVPELDLKRASPYFTAAGGFISTASDLVKWNTSLHGGKILADSTYRLMMTKHKNAIREHPLFGRLQYGYGITIDDNDGILQLGQTGRVPGFNSINFYYPATKTSVTVLNNVQRNLQDIHKLFYYHREVVRIVRESLLHRK
jgi:D-alanyl-D-alanine carboxypeptidase